MNWEVFLNLPTEQIAQLVRETGTKVCVFPINGTRRWFVLEHPEPASGKLAEDYLGIAGRRHIELYKLLFDHGIQTLLTPIFGQDILERGRGYRELLGRGLVWFAQDRDFLQFYDEYDVRVRVYGETRRFLQGTPYAHAVDIYEDLTRRTASHQSYRLFFGVCAHDVAQTVAAIGIRFHEQHRRPPNKREIVEAYYGEYVEPVDLFIGSDRPAVYDMPLIATGSEDLYFTVAPSPYLDCHTLRKILYDHLYTRHVNDNSYDQLSVNDWRAMADFYTLNRRGVLGLGCKHRSSSFWYPTPQVSLSPHLLADEDDCSPETLESCRSTSQSVHTRKHL
jgi:tuberculosinol/isotuberculosinol synthase